jgi:hypothetical protein
MAESTIVSTAFTRWSVARMEERVPPITPATALSLRPVIVVLTLFITFFGDSRLAYGGYYCAGHRQVAREGDNSRR